MHMQPTGSGVPPLDRPPDHFITLTSDHPTDVQTTADAGITAVLAAGVGEHECVLADVMRDIVAIRILHNSLPPHDARLVISVGGMDSAATAIGSAAQHTATELDAAESDASLRELVHSDVTSYEFPVLSTATVRYDVDPTTGKLTSKHTTDGGASRGMYQRSIAANDLAPVYLDPRGAKGRHGRDVKRISVRWLDGCGETIPRVRRIEAYRTLRLRMPPKVVLMQSTGGDPLPATLHGAYITPHAGGSVLGVMVLQGTFDAARNGQYARGSSISSTDCMCEAETREGRALEVRILPSSGSKIEWGTIDPTVVIVSAGLGYVVGDRLTIYASANAAVCGRSSMLPGTLNVVLVVTAVSKASPLVARAGRTPIMARVTACTPPLTDRLSGGVTTIGSGALSTVYRGYTTTPVVGADDDDNFVPYGVDAARRQHVYRGVSVGDPFVDVLDAHGKFPVEPLPMHPEFPLIFDLHVNAEGAAWVVITSMGGPLLHGDNALGIYVHVRPGFFLPRRIDNPPTVTFMWLTDYVATSGDTVIASAKTSVLVATTPSFVHNYKWILDPTTAELTCETPGEVSVDGVPLAGLPPGARVLVQSLNDMCSVECLASSMDVDAAVSTPAQYNGIYTVMHAGSPRRPAILCPTTDALDSFTDMNFLKRIPVERGDLHGGTLRIPDLSAFHLPGDPLPFRQWTGADDTSTATSIAELTYLSYKKNAWVPSSSPSVVFGAAVAGRTGDALVDVYAPPPDTAMECRGHQPGAVPRPTLMRPIANMLQIGDADAGTACPNATIRDTLELMTSPFSRFAGPVMHIASVSDTATACRRGGSTRPLAAVEELNTIDRPPRKRVHDEYGASLPRHVESHGGMLGVDVDIPDVSFARPTAARIQTGQRVAIVAGDTHNTTLRKSLQTMRWIGDGVVATTDNRVHGIGSAYVENIQAVHREEVGMMPWSLTLGFYTSC
jgi:hypothetical protein